MKIVVRTDQAAALRAGRILGGPTAEIEIDGLPPDELALIGRHLATDSRGGLSLPITVDDAAAAAVIAALRGIEERERADEVRHQGY